jgi:hypothetical protein
MNHSELLASLETSGNTIVTLLANVPDEVMRWKPAPEQWSMLEVLCHLIDEEREDFGRRLALTLEDPEQPWPSMNPEALVTERAYNEQDPVDKLDHFKHARVGTLNWLRSLANPPWHNEHKHPRFDSLSAGDLLAAWVAHDLRHVRQLTNLRLAWLEEAAKPYSIAYAG